MGSFKNIYLNVKARFKCLVLITVYILLECFQNALILHQALSVKIVIIIQFK